MMFGLKLIVFLFTASLVLADLPPKIKFFKLENISPCDNDTDLAVSTKDVSMGFSRNIINLRGNFEVKEELDLDLQVGFSKSTICLFHSDWILDWIDSIQMRWSRLPMRTVYQQHHYKCLWSNRGAPNLKANPTQCWVSFEAGCLRFKQCLLELRWHFKFAYWGISLECSNGWLQNYRRRRTRDGCLLECLCACLSWLKSPH